MEYLIAENRKGHSDPHGEMSSQNAILIDHDKIMIQKYQSLRILIMPAD